MTDKPDGENKPFYEDILSKKNRPSRKRKNNEGPGAKKPRTDQASTDNKADPRIPGSGPASPRRSPGTGRFGPDRGGPARRGQARQGPARRGPVNPHADNEFAESQRLFAREQSEQRGTDRSDSAGREPYGRGPYRGRQDSGRDGRSDRPPSGRSGDRRDDRRNERFSERSNERSGDFRPRAGASAGGGYKGKPFVPPQAGIPVFGTLPGETRALLEAFPDIVQSVFPMDSKKIQGLPNDIRELSHELTDERSERRVGYMNEPPVLGAYIRYYQWWNLVRLTRIFSALPLELNDGDAAVDLGSGPLTLPIALWMARPDLRAKKILWYCVDISQGALAAGEELFLALAAKTGNEPWEIVRIKGECGVSLRRKVSLVASANMFNELFWDNPLPLEAQAKHHAETLASYADRNASILVIEPGVPRAGRFVSLLRDSLIRTGFEAVAPCPHQTTCPFPGLRYGKWCHFVFDTVDAPAKLHKLSEDAGLSKDRAALSFVYSTRTENARVEPATDAEPESAVLPDAAEAPVSAEAPSLVMSRLSSMFPDLSVRITSDPIKLPDFYTGRYGCSEMGMVLLTGTYAAADYLKGLDSGSFVTVPRPAHKKAETDQKTGALLIRLK